MNRQVSALRNVLSEQAIGVLVRPTLPRALRIAKIYVDLGRQRKARLSHTKIEARLGTRHRGTMLEMPEQSGMSAGLGQYGALQHKW